MPTSFTQLERLAGGTARPTAKVTVDAVRTLLSIARRRTVLLDSGIRASPACEASPS